MKKIKEQNYNSAYGFVNENKLHTEATELFGIDWVAEDDVDLISELLKFVGRKDLEVRLIETVAENDIEVFSRKEHLSLEQINDLSVRIVGNLVNVGAIIDCTDTEREIEFDAQDQIRLVLGLEFGYTEEEIFNN